MLGCCSLGKQYIGQDLSEVAVEESNQIISFLNLEFQATIQQKDIFESVEYSGYTYADSTESYTIHVVCCLTEGAGR